jgi:predicted GNAT family N-acyltransferase
MIKIKSNLTDDEKFQIYHLRYNVYVEEFEYQQSYANHKEKIIYEPLDDNAYLVGAFLDNQAVGTIRCNLVSQSNIGYYSDLYKIDSISADSTQKAITTKFIIEKKHRNTILAHRLFQAAYEYYLQQNVKYAFSDCELTLLNFCQRYGCKPILEVKHPELGGEGIVMLLEIFDFEYLKQINSPFMRGNKFKIN